MRLHQFAPGDVLERPRYVGAVPVGQRRGAAHLGPDRPAGAGGAPALQDERHAGVQAACDGVAQGGNILWLVELQPLGQAGLPALGPLDDIEYPVGPCEIVRVRVGLPASQSGGAQGFLGKQFVGLKLRLGQPTLGDVCVRDHGPARFRSGKARHAAEKPPLLGRRMAGVFQREPFLLAAQHGAQTGRKGGGVGGFGSGRRVADR